jgi:heat shock protein HtpX
LPPARELVTSSHLMIVNPFRAGGLSRLFASHPPMAERIARLEALGGHPR